mmetsp:Transcript_12115/g.22242  ORF Transcript_12115/g.22242 Transcript_12115/m.22242 type:complete len:247 (+) Transcript_12115:20-760(+)
MGPCGFHSGTINLVRWHSQGSWVAFTLFYPATRQAAQLLKTIQLKVAKLVFEGKPIFCLLSHKLPGPPAFLLYPCNNLRWRPLAFLLLLLLLAFYLGLRCSCFRLHGFRQGHFLFQLLSCGSLGLFNRRNLATESRESSWIKFRDLLRSECCRNGQVVAWAPAIRQAGLGCTWVLLQGFPSRLELQGPQGVEDMIQCPRHAWSAILAMVIRGTSWPRWHTRKPNTHCGSCLQCLFTQSFPILQLLC